MSKTKIIKNKNDVIEMRNLILQSAQKTQDRLRVNVNEDNALKTMFDIKFDQIGVEPLDHSALNFIEQLNQLFTYLISVEGILYLMEQHPETTYIVNFGTASGFDIESEDGTIVAECFTATSPNSNNKLQRDVERLSQKSNHLFKYVIYYTFNEKLVYVENIRKKFPDVNIKKIDLSSFF